MVNSKSFLTQAFEEFHQILFNYRKKVIDSLFFSSLDSEEQKNQKILNIQLDAQSFIKGKFSQIFHEAGKIGGALFEEVSYVMAALADEIFINLNWDGRDYWKKNLLEEKLFNSHYAGEKIFQNINRVLNDQGFDAVELAIVYFYCLSLGFKGFLRTVPDSALKIQDLKEKLYYKIYFKDSKLFKEQLKLFPSAYKAMFIEKKISFENPVVFWKKILVGSVIGYLLLVEFMWNYNMRIYFDLLGRFIEVIR